MSAREIKTGRTFQFVVTDSKLLRALKVGQGVYADFATKKVSLDGLAPCCTMRLTPVAPKTGPTR